MEDLERDSLYLLKNSYGYASFFYFRYVDDTIFCNHKDKVDLVLNVFNNCRESLKFTYEIEERGSLVFLDVSIIREGDKLITNWYRKPNSSDRILNFKSYHNRNLKRNIIFNLIGRAILLSNKKFHQDNIKIVTDLLLKNNYKQNFIKNSIQRRLKKIETSKSNQASEDKSNNDCQTLFTLSLPYSEEFFNKCSRILKPFRIRTVPYFNNKLNNVIVLCKDPTDQWHQTNVAYKFNCSSCSACYVGETKRELKTRIYDHRDDCKRLNTSSVVSLHIIENDGHIFDFDNTRILDKESTWSKRITSEMLFINNQYNVINKKSDSNSLNRIYNVFSKPILNNRIDIDEISLILTTQR